MCGNTAELNGLEKLHDRHNNEKYSDFFGSYQEIRVAYTFNQWEELREELYCEIAACGQNMCAVRHIVNGILMKLRFVAPYFHSGQSGNVCDLFGRIIQVHALGDFGHSWNTDWYRDVAAIGVAMNRLAHIIQGCLYEAGVRRTLYDFEKECGVCILKDLTAESLAEAMDWTTELAGTYMGLQKAPERKIAPLSTIDELKEAFDKGLILKNGSLQCSVRHFVMHCYERGFFLPMNKSDWVGIDSLLVSDRGRLLTASVLAKTAQQLRKEGYIEDRIRLNHTGHH